MFIVTKNDIISSNGPRHQPLLEDPQIYPKYSGEEPFVQSSFWYFVSYHFWHFCQEFMECRLQNTNSHCGSWAMPTLVKAGRPILPPKYCILLTQLQFQLEVNRHNIPLSQPKSREIRQIMKSHAWMNKISYNNLQKELRHTTD